MKAPASLQSKEVQAYQVVLRKNLKRWRKRLARTKAQIKQLKDPRSTRAKRLRYRLRDQLELYRQAQILCHLSGLSVRPVVTQREWDPTHPDFHLGSIPVPPAWLIDQFTDILNPLDDDDAGLAA